MNKEYILKEGLLEKLLLDELTVDESEAVELAMENNPELRQRFQLLEADFERMAFENAIAPPPHVKNLLKYQMDSVKDDTWPTHWLWAAASLAVIFMLTTFWMYTKWQSAKGELNALQNQSVVLEERLDLLEENYELTNHRLQLINSPSTIPFVLRGNKKTPNSRAVAYVNHDNKLVVVNPKGLPVLPQDQTYQMWSDVNGEMINMGLLPTDKELVTLKYIDQAESLNITIEPAGGNDHPTVEQLISYVTL